MRRHREYKCAKKKLSFGGTQLGNKGRKCGTMRPEPSRARDVGDRWEKTRRQMGASPDTRAKSCGQIIQAFQKE